MEPYLKNNDKILAFKKYFFLIKVNDVVIVKVENKILIKRVLKIKDKKYFLKGDNVKYSTDSRNFGLIQNKDIIGKMILKI